MPGPDPLSDFSHTHAADPLKEEKAALRARARTRRKRAHGENPEAGTALAGGALENLEHWRRERDFAGRAPIAAGYQPMASEIDPRPLMRALAGKGWDLALPVVVGAGEALAFRAWRPGDALAAGVMGIPEPGPAAPECTPDVLLVPLLAFDSRGNRLGQGGGFYDRTIAALGAAGAAPLCVGLAYAAQRFEDLVSGPFDQPLDAVATESGYEIPTGEGR